MSVCDLGCGCGMLSFGCSILGAAYVLGVDVDSDALNIALKNQTTWSAEDVETASSLVVDFVQQDILSEACFLGHPNPSLGLFDTVIMNPPFGTKKNAGIDMKFLECAIRISKGAVYSFHKTSTRDYISKHMRRAFQYSTFVVSQLEFEIPQMYKCHKKKSVFIQVDFLRFYPLHRK
eukprot:Sdes_comp20728_c0_seq1m16529